MYSALVYPQVATGGSYTTPVLPSTFVSLGYTSPTWNPFSANSADRTQWWVDTAGTLTQAQAMTACYGAAGVIALQATAALGAGLAITSTGTPAINGTYAIASGIPFGREDIGTEAQFVSTFSEFTNGTQTLEWPLIDGKTFVTFPSTASYMNFAKAAAQYYAAVKAVVAAGQGSFPSNQVTIP